MPVTRTNTDLKACTSTGRSEATQAARRRRLLDLFCGAGGAAVGYHRAGFAEIVGVDHRPQKRYPFEFVLGDALEFLASVRLGDFDAIHCSPPCQAYSRLRHLPWLKGREWPKLIDPCRAQLTALGIPWVVENVEDAPLSGIVLCGTQFGLKVYRHRRFESSHVLFAPDHEKHRVRSGRGRELSSRFAGENADGWVSLARTKSRTYRAGLPVVIHGQPCYSSAHPREISRSSVAGHFTKGTLNQPLSSGLVTVAGHQTCTQIAGAAMGIDWMIRDELSQAIPPAFTEYVGRQLLRQISGEALVEGGGA